MTEVAHAGHDHGDAMLVGGGDDLVVAHGASRLNDGGGAGFHGGEKPVGEGKEGVGGDDRTLGQRLGIAGSLCRVLG